MVFTTEGSFDVAMESWPEWDLNPRPLNSIQTLYLYFEYLVGSYITAMFSIEGNE